MSRKQIILSLFLKLVYYSNRNKYRVLPCHRPDLSFTFNKDLRKERMWKENRTFSVYNIYVINNPLSVDYRKTIRESSGSENYSLYKLPAIVAPIRSLAYILLPDIKWLIYLLAIMLSVSCEEIYRPDIDQVEDLTVVEAIFISNRTQNSVYLYQTRGFYETDSTYPAVGGATVYLIDDTGNQLICKEGSEGVYTLNQMLDPQRQYSLNIELDGEKYVSDIQPVPDIPKLDTIYGEYDFEITINGTASSSDKIERDYGFQLYSDMKYNGNLNHYRFDGRKILQYNDKFIIEGLPPKVLPIYIWRSMYPTGAFNISGPPEYSTSKDITKHPLEFFPQNYNKYFPDTMSFAGWIYIIYQYGLNEDTYNYYKKINQQLDNEGKIFDPIYIQLEGNITCETNPDKKILGNFEISSYSESRCYLSYNKRDEDFRIKRITYFYDIPYSGYEINNRPDFWELMNKQYPDE